MATIAPQLAVVNATYLDINGLQLSNDATTPNTILDIAPGQCRDSTNSNDIYLPATKVILGGNTLTQPPFINQTVANPITVSTAINGAGGLDVGTIAASTMYYVYAIGSSVAQISTGQPVSVYPGNAIISLSIIQPVLPYGYDMFRRIGTIVTSGGSNILGFRQVGNGLTRRMMYNVPIASAIATGNATVNTSVVINTTPTTPAISTLVYFQVSFTPGTAGHEIILVPTGAGASDVYASMSGDVAAVDHVGQMVCPCSVTPQVSYRVTNSADAVAIAITGFDDQL